ncbi:hypothetical protein C0J52_25817 [Blattella germanica]|nr:hypothetical protein C0J52_25817 [Blattella germanica]
MAPYPKSQTPESQMPPMSTSVYKKGQYEDSFKMETSDICVVKINDRGKCLIRLPFLDNLKT